MIGLIQILGFFVPGSSYWNVAIGREKGEAGNDKEGMDTVWNFGRNMALLMKKLKELKTAPRPVPLAPPPEAA